MINTGKLAGRTIFITGASRGIGKSIALKAAKDGANIVIAAKTAQAHPKLPGTIYTAANEIEAAGGKALPCIVDVRDEAQVINAVENAVAKFGGIDVVVNNASAISLTDTVSTDMKRYDLMNNINARGTFLVSKICIPYLKKSANPHIINISPPLNMKPIWFKNHVAYTIAKYGMSMCVLGMAEELKLDNIAVNAVWPKTGRLKCRGELENRFLLLAA
nr:PREDICTED: hydroxysteroid dehydrogenase-like protein 2 isoform X1 [Linepithema humile]